MCRLTRISARDIDVGKRTRDTKDNCLSNLVPISLPCRRKGRTHFDSGRHIRMRKRSQSRPCRARIGHAGLTSSRALITRQLTAGCIPHRTRNVLSSADLGGGAYKRQFASFQGPAMGSQALIADIGPRRMYSKWISLSRLAGDCRNKRGELAPGDGDDGSKHGWV